MCGIVGVSGKNNAVTFLLDGLKSLEYRGYDSVGIAVQKTEKIETYKQKGRVSALSDKVKNVIANCGIGHTRWATHGKPSDENSHPHVSGRFAVVHNGIIENYLDLKAKLINNGFAFTSETDTEVVAHLLAKNYNGNLAETLVKTTAMLAGSYALAVMCSDYPGVIAVCKKDNPLIVGRGKEGNFLASDAPALAGRVDDVYVMQDGDMALIYPDRIEFFDINLKSVKKDFEKAQISASELELGKYESFMMKEINEIPFALSETFENLKAHGIGKDALIKLKQANKITIIGCGTAYHSGLVAKTVIEKYARIPVTVEVASEYRYRDPIITKNEVIIAVSQSGETADTIAAVKLAKSQGAYVITITNVSGSSLTTHSDCVLHTKAGPEIAVAATKSYNTQLAAFYYIAYAMQGKEEELFEKSSEIVEKAREVISKESELVSLAGELSSVTNAFFLGRGADYCTALEGSLKLKEISYVHSEGCPAGELKHGTLALIEKGTLVVTLITSRDIADKTMNAIHEVKARGAKVVLVSPFEEYLTAHGVDEMVKLPSLDEVFTPIISIIPLQIFAYYISRARGNDPDKPRNLAKSVTVE